MLSTLPPQVALTVTALLLPALARAQTSPFPEPLGQRALQAQETPPQAVAGELIIAYSAGTTVQERQAVRAQIGATLIEDLTTAAMRSTNAGELELVRLPSQLASTAAIEALGFESSVRFAEPNWIYTHQASSNDPYYTGGYLWGMYGDGTSPTNQFGCQAGEAWAAGNTGSSSVIVAVIDEGVQHTHQDLSANIWSNPFDPADGIDNDGNGYKDDLRGWDFAGNNNSTYDGTADDHGTHVAGTIGGVGGNGIGVVGVSWNVKIISCKFLGSGGGTTANAVKAVDYVTDLKNRHGLNIVATNNSWGGGGYAQSLFEAINRANTANILFIAAAGNAGKNNDASANYPSNYTNANIIAVASITSSGTRSSFSNYGKNTVDIGAPGSSILSTMPNTAGNKYGYMSGTSMATPHVTGAAALYAASHPGASAASIKNAILNSATATSSLNGLCVTGGRLNASGF
jgi:subtilisin family serine protease